MSRRTNGLKNFRIIIGLMLGLALGVDVNYYEHASSLWLLFGYCLIIVYNVFIA